MKKTALAWALLSALALAGMVAPPVRGDPHAVHELQSRVSVLETGTRLRIDELSRATQDGDAQLKEQLQRSEEGLKRLLDAQDKRFDALNTWLAMFAILTTVMFFAAGFFAYFTATNRARDEARDWLEKHKTGFKQDFEGHGRAVTDELLGSIEARGKTMIEQIERGGKASIEQVALDARQRFEQELSAHKSALAAALDRGLGAPLTPAQAGALEAEAAVLLKTPVAARSYADLRTLGIAAFDRGDEGEALDLLTQALAVASGPFERTQGNRSQGALLFNRSRYEDALRAFEQALEESRAGNAADGPLQVEVAKARLGRADALNVLDRFEPASSAYQDVLSHCDASANIDFKRIVAAAHLGRGNLLTNRKSWREAEAAYQTAIAGFGQEPDQDIEETVALARLGLGGLHWLRGDVQSACAAYRDFESRYRNTTLALIAGKVEKAREYMLQLGCDKA